VGLCCGIEGVAQDSLLKVRPIDGVWVLDSIYIAHSDGKIKKIKGKDLPDTLSERCPIELIITDSLNSVIFKGGIKLDYITCFVYKNTLMLSFNAAHRADYSWRVNNETMLILRTINDAENHQDNIRLFYKKESIQNDR
jgi:hypothetical protein